MNNDEMPDRAYTFIRDKFMCEMLIPLTDEQIEGHWNVLGEEDRDVILTLIDDHGANFAWDGVVDDMLDQRDPVQTELTTDIMAQLHPYMNNYFANLGIEDVTDGQIYQMWSNMKEAMRTNWLAQSRGEPTKPIPMMVDDPAPAKDDDWAADDGGGPGHEPPDFKHF